MRKRLRVVPIIIVFLPILFMDMFLPVLYPVAIAVAIIISIEIFFMANITFKNNPLLISITIIFIIVEYIGILIFRGALPFKIGISLSPLEFILMSILAFVIVLIAINMWNKKDSSFESNGTNILISLFIFVYIGAGFAHFLLIRLMPHGGYLIFFILGCSWISDTGGYTIGRYYGKHKMIHSASPNKTYAGIGGMFLFSYIFTTLFILGSKTGFFSPLLGSDILPYSNTTMYILTFVFTITGFLGDMGESIIKRMYNKKDSGKILPGHGGTFDIFDSVITTSLIGYYIFLFL